MNQVFGPDNGPYGSKAKEIGTSLAMLESVNEAPLFGAIMAFSAVMEVGKAIAAGVAATTFRIRGEAILEYNWPIATFKLFNSPNEALALLNGFIMSATA